MPIRTAIRLSRNTVVPWLTIGWRGGVTAGAAGAKIDGETDATVGPDVVGAAGCDDPSIRCGALTADACTVTIADAVLRIHAGGRQRVNAAIPDTLAIATIANPRVTVPAHAYTRCSRARATSRASRRQYRQAEVPGRRS